MTKPLRRLLAATLTLVAALAVIVVPQSPASAYALHNCKMPSTTTTWQDLTGGGAYGSAAYSAIAAWQNTSTPNSFHIVGSNGQMLLKQENWGSFTWSGRTDGSVGAPYCNSSMGTWANLPLTLWLNRRYTDAYPAGKKQTVWVHEIGHALGIAHTGNNVCAGMPIMFQGTDEKWNCGLNTPQADDINGVNYIY
ncbi:matrixin family metalloprotease [Micromonospora sp. NPDC004704]